jgi:cytochrome P460
MKVALSLTALLAIAAAIPAGDLPTVPYPQAFRSWQHVKSIVIGPEHPSFETRGGIHHYYANALATEGYRTGTFPDGSVIVDEGVFTRAADGPAKGITLEGDRRSVDVMVKNTRLYAATDGWGFEHFNGNEQTATPDAARRGKCLECHAKAQRDHVYSQLRP